MQKVYLIRHGHPDIPLGERWCLGRTDLPLAPVGRMQAALLPFDPELTGKPVFSSYLLRARETAYPLCPNPLVREGLEEQDLGEWDGLPFSEIMQRWPELYAAREKDPDIWPESAETTETVRRREEENRGEAAGLREPGENGMREQANREARETSWKKTRRIRREFR